MKPESRTMLTEGADTGNSNFLFLSYAVARRYKELNHPRDATVKFDTDEIGAFTIPRLLLKQHHPFTSKIGRHVLCMPPSAKAEREERKARNCYGCCFCSRRSFFFKFCCLCCLNSHEVTNGNTSNDEDDDDDDDDYDNDNNDDDKGDERGNNSEITSKPIDVVSPKENDTQPVAASIESQHSSTPFFSRRKRLLNSRSVVGDFGKYGNGVSLYFKALGFLTFLTFLLSVIAIAPLLIFRAVSLTSTSLTSSSSSSSSTITDSSLFDVFSTLSLASLGDSSTVCSSGHSAMSNTVSVSCPRGRITAVEASFGSPTGECTCPAQQTPSLGICPGAISDVGDSCLPSLSSKCFFSEARTVSLPSGATFRSTPCCSSSLINGKPSFHDLDIRDGTSIPGQAGCAADFSFIQMIARGMCLGKTSCTLPTDNNTVVEWTPVQGTLRSIFSPSLSRGLLNTNQDTPCPPLSVTSGSSCKATIGEAPGLSSCIDRGSSTNNPYAYRNSTGFRLMLVATCSLEELILPSWLAQLSSSNSRSISRSSVALVPLITSFTIAVTFLCASILLFKRESRHSSFATTPADYTIMVTRLPHHRSLSELERTLRRHFEVVLRKDAPADATEDEKMTLAREEESLCEIADINFGIKDSKGVFDLFHARGRLLHSLERLGRIELIADAENDLKGREIARLQILTVIDKIALCDEEIDKRRGEAVVLEDEDGHFVGKLALKATAAFLTFNHQEAASRALDAYPASFLRWICMPRRLQLTDPTFWRPWVTRAPDPSDIYWSNLSITFFNRLLRRLVNLIILTVALFVALAIVFFVAQSKQDLLRIYPVVDCAALLQSETRLQASVSGVSLAIAASMGRFVFTQSDTQVTPGVNAFSKAGVVTDVYFKELGLSSGNSGALHCYCSNLASYSDGSSSLSSLITETFPALLPSNSSAVRNNPPDRTTLCNGWMKNFLFVNGLRYGSSVITLVINILLSTIVYKLVKFERHWNRTTEVQSRALYLLIVQFINTGALVLLLNADIPSSLWLFRVGRFNDLTSQWYKSAGSPIVLTMVINILLPHVFPLLQVFSKSCLRCIDRRCTFDRTLTRSMTQTELNKLQLGPEMALDERYAQIVTTIFVCLTYSTGMPLLLPILFVSMAVMLIADKLFFTLAYRTPPVINSDLPKAFSAILPIATITQLSIGAWMLSSEDLFPLAENLADTAAVSSINNFSSYGASFAKAVSKFSAWEPVTSIPLGKRLLTVQAMPLFLFCAVLIIYVLLSPLLSCFLFRVCGIGLTTSTTTAMSIKKRRKRATYFMAIPPDDVEAAAKGAKDVKPELKPHFNKAYEKQSKGKAREQLTILVEKYEKFNSIAVDATRTMERAMDAITESSTETNRLTEAGVTPASPDQILADSRSFAKQASEDLERALTIAQSFTNRTKTNRQVNEEIGEGGGDEKEKEEKITTTLGVVTTGAVSDQGPPDIIRDALQLGVDDNISVVDTSGFDDSVDIASPRSPPLPQTLPSRRLSIRRKSSGAGNPFGPSSLNRRASGAGNPFAESSPPPPLPPPLTTSTAVPEPPSVLPPSTPFGNPFGSPQDSNDVGGGETLDARRMSSSRRSSRIRPPSLPPVLSSSSTMVAVASAQEATAESEVSVKKSEFKGYDSETIGRSPPSGSAFEVNDSGRLQAAPLAPSQRKLIELSAKIREAAHSRDVAQAELNKATERMNELKKRIRTTIQSGRSLSTDGMKGGKSMYFSSGLYGYDFHEERSLRHDFGLDADVHENYKRRIDDAERRRGREKK